MNRFALVGNPNCGKTTLFNELTGSNQYVGNWPGVTVEKKEGKAIFDDTEVTIVDLPGIYSLSPYSMEEVVARNYIIDSKPELIINIVDATNLERNLYLSLQLAELGKPMIIALNMVDVAEKRGYKIDCDKLSRYLSIPVFPISASKKRGIEKMMNAANHEVLHSKELNHFDRHISDYSPPDIYSVDVLNAILKIEKIITQNCEYKGFPLRWSAVKALEGDMLTVDALTLSEEQKFEIEYTVKSLETKNSDREIIIADQKYKFICSICGKSVFKPDMKNRLSVSNRIDNIVTNKFLAIPIFLVVMLIIFFISFGTIGTFLTDLVDSVINVNFAGLVRDVLSSVGASDWAIGLLCDGIISGVGTVLSFFPQIFLLFLCLSLLEDTGYMSRGAFIMDRAFHKLGLSGKSFVPLIMGFGCSVPAIMASRTLESQKDRRLTIMMTPFMSCGAKMPIYALFISAFFKEHKVVVIFSIYIIGIVVAILSAILLQKTVLKGAHGAFVMELPDYRLPTFKTIGRSLWDRIKDFLSKAATILVGASVVIWFLQYFGAGFVHVTDSSQSFLAVIGKFIAPIFIPLGFGMWQFSVATLSGLIAKESVVTTLGILFASNAEGIELSQTMLGIPGFTGLNAFCFMIFSLLFIPCSASVITIRKEMKSVKWTVGALLFQACTAWFITFLIYQIGSIFG